MLTRKEAAEEMKAMLPHLEGVTIVGRTAYEMAIEALSAHVDEGDYISREAALSFPFANGQYDHENANEHFINGCESYKEWLEAVPTADVRPVVHGKDVCNTVKDHHCEFKCSICGEEIREYWGEDFNFCPYCGADMREETDA